MIVTSSTRTDAWERLWNRLLADAREPVDSEHATHEQRRGAEEAMDDHTEKLLNGNGAASQ